MLQNNKIEPTQADSTQDLPTPEQVRLLNESFAVLAPRGEAFVDRFYENLFDHYPATRLLFEESRFAMTQKQVLNALVLTIQGLSDPEKLAPLLMQLGARHVRYGVLPSYLPMFERAAMTTLKEFLAPQWNDELDRAWSVALHTVVHLMQQGVTQSHLHAGKTEDHRLGPAARAARAQKIEKAPWHKPFTHAYMKAPQWMAKALVWIIVVAVFIAANGVPLVSDLLGKIAQISILTALLLWFKEIPARKTKAIFDAFQVIDSSKGSRTSPARKMALESLTRYGASLREIDLSRISLVGVSLKGVDLAAASLVETDLRQADLTGANLMEANLSMTQLSQAHLSQACISFANLTGADLTLANLEGADLTCANLTGANLSGANLKGANLAGTEVLKTSLAGANLLIADLTGVNLTNVDLRGAIMPDGTMAKTSRESSEPEEGAEPDATPDHDGIERFPGSPPHRKTSS